MKQTTFLSKKSFKARADFLFNSKHTIVRCHPQLDNLKIIAIIKVHKNEIPKEWLSIVPDDLQKNI